MHVVVLAYGPAHSTKRAVRRAGQLAAKSGEAGKHGEVITVPATALAGPAIAELNGARTVNEPARAGLHEALLALNESPPFSSTTTSSSPPRAWRPWNVASTVGTAT